MAKRYGVLPSELKNRSISDYQFDTLVATIALENEAKQIKKQSAKTGRKR